MKRNHLALLLAIIMITGCIFASVPAATATEADSAAGDTTADAPAGDTPAEDTPADESAEDAQPKLITRIVIYIIKFFKWLLALLGL